ncbi:M18 family aminopeptidase [Corynebacterium tapiri]|uniref:M18 family aminopeptidase n=1 Tax=Corynebacterium tapiri TaxID=1448266 RepID=A0A5C4U5L3_9CORY|nr:M18 family aminopeptidase [Corynebacterium tapiri]TNL97609.1 M18 family aminopeptidase [Corynebacterium tapiri]
MNQTHDLISFLSASPSAYHAARIVADRLGFDVHDETRPLPVSEGGHTVVRGGAVISYVIPENPRGFRIIGTHTDSPGFMLKPQPDFQAHGFDQVGVEIYGGPIISSWFDRDLTVAGRVVLIDGTEHLVDLGPCVRIPNLAIHLGQTELDKQTHVQPISGIGPIMDAVAAQLGVDVADIAGHELITTDAQPAEVLGGFLSAGRLDNLSSVHAGLCAFERAAKDAEDILVFAAFNHEEVGSSTAQGAAGPFLEDVLTRVAEGLGRNPREMFAASSCVSADAAHSVHPNYAAKHDPHHQPILNGGPVTKINAKQRYASDAVSIAMWERACAGIPHQTFVGNNAVPCGTTIGPLTATRLGISTVDVGVPLLSMHSARELVGTQDQLWLTDALEAYLIGS